MADRWIPYTFADGFFPPNAQHAGFDVDGDSIFVGRAYHGNDLLPAKVIPNKQACYVAYGGEEIFKDSFEVFVPPMVYWEPASNGEIPPFAVIAGSTEQGEPLYCGRVSHDGAMTPGKVHPSHGTCYYPFGGQERSCPIYEVLVLK